MFDKAEIEIVLKAANLSLEGQVCLAHLQDRLDDLAAEYYWAKFSPPSSGSGESYFIFDSIADASVSPSRLRNRLSGIQRAAIRAQLTNSRHPINTRVAELLERLGYNSDGTPKRYSGTEKSGHGGSERSAVWLCLVRAVSALERPPQGYRPQPGERPWGSQRLEGAIRSLVAFMQSPEDNRLGALNAAKCLAAWAEWAAEKVAPLITSEPARHRGLSALDATIMKLAVLYQETFDKKPSLSHRNGPGGEVIPNTWELFLHAVLERILAPEQAPSLSALEARWRRLAYTDRKNRI